MQFNQTESIKERPVMSSSMRFYSFQACFFYFFFHFFEKLQFCKTKRNTPVPPEKETKYFFLYLAHQQRVKDGKAGQGRTKTNWTFSFSFLSLFVLSCILTKTALFVRSLSQGDLPSAFQTCCRVVFLPPHGPLQTKSSPWFLVMALVPSWWPPSRPFSRFGFFSKNFETFFCLFFEKNNTKK